MVQAVSFEDEAKALSLMAEGDKATRQPHDDYAGDLKKNPTGATKWNASPYIGNAIDARLNHTPGYEQQLVAGLECYKAAIDYAPGNSDVRHKAISAYSYKAQEYELFKRPTEELARIALYEARNSRQPEKYAARWAGLLRIEATHDPLTTAYDLLRDAHKSPDDDLVSRTGAQVFGEIVKRMAMSPDPEGPTLAIRLADKAQEWLDWTFSVQNDWGRAKKADSELSKQIIEIRAIAEPIAELNKMHEAEKALHLRQAEFGAQIAAKIRPAVANVAEAPIAVAADAPPVLAPAAGRLLQMELPKGGIPPSLVAPGIGIAS